MAESTVNDFFTEPEQNPLEKIPKSALVFAGDSQNQMMQMAELLADSTIVPATYQRNPSNCFIAVDFAKRIGCSPMTVLQNLDIILGRPSWSSKFLISLFNTSGKYTPIKYKMFGTEADGDEFGCIAYATELDTGELLEGPKVTIAMARAEGWLTKSGSKWKTIPNLMIRYRAAAFMIRLYAPQLALGLLTTEEKKDIEINITPSRTERSAAEKAWEEQNVSETT